MKRYFSLLLATMILGTAHSPLAGAAENIGLSLPLTGRFQPIASRLEFGALQAIEDLKKSGQDVELVIADDGCDPINAGDIAGKFLTEKTKVVVGPVCFQFAAALSKALSTADGAPARLPIISFNTRNKLQKRLRDVDELPLYSLSNPHDGEAQAIVERILPRFKGKPFAIVDDGSVYGRALSDDIRLLGEQYGFKAVVNTNFRPLQSTQISMLRRLRNSGVEAVFIAAAAEDVITIANDMRTLGLEWTIATGERGELLPYTTTSDTPLDGLLMVQERELQLAEADDDLNKRLPDATTRAGYALVQLAAAGLQKTAEPWNAKTFDTILGPVTFDQSGHAAPAPFELYVWEDGGFELVKAD